MTAEENRAESVWRERRRGKKAESERRVKEIYYEKETVLTYMRPRVP